MHSAVLYAKHLDSLARFYAHLGLCESRGEAGEFAILSSPGTELVLVQVPQRIADQIQISDPPAARSQTAIKLCFAVPGLEPALEAWLSAGGALLQGAGTWEFQGHAVQDVVDPEGNVVQLRGPS